MKKYWHLYTMTITKQLSYRVNFLLGRFQNLIILLLLYYVWTTVSARTGLFAGFTKDELVTYIFIVHLLRACVFGTMSTLPAEEINDGTFSGFIIKPLSHIGLCYARDLADRTVLTLSAVIEISLITVIGNIHLITPDWTTILYALTFIISAHILYFLLSYLLNLFAFWSHEAIGPRFFFNWVAEFASGAYFPLLLTPILFTVLSFTPFPYFVYVPILGYLGKTPFSMISIGMLCSWIIVAFLAVRSVWRVGLKHYSGQGI